MPTREISGCFSQSSKYKNTTATSEKIKVTIEDTSIAFKQTALKKFDINFGSEVNLTSADVSINEVVVGPSDEYRVNTLVKSVTMSEDKKTATVELFYDMKDGVSYEVTVKGYDMQTLVASAGTPVAVNVWAQDAYYKPIVAGQVTVGQMTTLKYTLIDANGVDVTTNTKEEQNKVVFNLKYTGKSGSSYDMAYYAGYADFDFVEVGDFAVVTAKYTTGEFENNVAKEVVSAETTFYAVAKQHITVKAVTGYTTQNKDWFDFGNAAKDVVKLGAFGDNNNYLVVKVVLVDGKEVDIVRQGQDIKDAEEVTHGYVTVEATKSAEDFLGVDAYTNNGDPATWFGNETNKITLRPRKVGTAQLMVYYNAILPDGNIQKTAIAPVTLKVSDAPTLGAVNLDYSGAQKTVVLSKLPVEAAQESLWKAEVSVQLKDQYGNDYYNAGNAKIKGSNDAAQDLVDMGAIYYDGKVKINGKLFSQKIDDMNTKISAENKKNISGKFYFTVEFQDFSTLATKSNTVVVDMRGVTKTATPGTDVSGEQSGNMARINHWTPWNAKAEKTVTFTAYQKMNEANVDYVTMAPYYTIGDINTATDGYYYRVFKNGSDVTKDLLTKTTDIWGNELLTSRIYNGTETPSTLMTQNGSSVTIRYSTVKEDQFGHYTVAYDYTGAGTYQFVLYKVEPSKYDNDKKVSTPVSSATKSVSVTCDTMKYNLTGRESYTIKYADGSVPADAANTYALEILKCFNFTNKDGAPFDRYSNKNSDEYAVFNGQQYLYEVKLNDEKQRPNSVFVDSITFYEVVDQKADSDDASTNDIDETKYDTIYAAYTVPVNGSIEFVEDK